MKPHEWYQKTLEKVQGTLEFELEGILLDLTEQIVRHMEREGINRSQLAKRLGCFPAQITKLLSGHPNMTLETIVKVARALNCEVALFLHTKLMLRVYQGNETPEFKKFNLTLALPSLSHEYSSAAAA